MIYERFCALMKNESAEVIKCELVPIGEYGNDPSKKNKFGRYHRTNFWNIEGFGSKKWVVAIRILPDDEEVYKQKTDREILEGCLKYLNTPPPRKKYAKKDPVPKYGILHPYQATRYYSDGKTFLSALAIVEQKKNKFFWGKGKNV